jgi:hypothetical protein
VVEKREEEEEKTKKNEFFHPVRPRLTFHSKRQQVALGVFSIHRKVCFFREERAPFRFWSFTRHKRKAISFFRWFSWVFLGGLYKQSRQLRFKTNTVKVSQAQRLCESRNPSEQVVIWLRQDSLEGKYS